MRTKPSAAAKPRSAASPAAPVAADPAPDQPLVPTDPAPTNPASAIVAQDPPELDAHGYDPAAYDWVPVLRKPRVDGWSPQRQRAFIGYLADCGSVRTAAERVGKSMSSAYQLRRSSGGGAFAAAWDSAIQQAAHVLVDEAFERAINGSDEPIFDRDGRRIGRKHRQSDALMMFLLRKHFPDRYGDLHRDRPERQAPVSLPPVAETMPALGPVVPPDPLSLMSPEDADAAMWCAELADGKLTRWHVQDGSEIEPHVDDPEFEGKLEDIMRAHDPIHTAYVDDCVAHWKAHEEHARSSRRR